ncbi:hypothetical protein VVR12_08155 [Rothia sp. LK2588]|uniref:hypothetical protein n=1 Tax=Rothia sp. LK2588 TaxID=3114369 RepID=UPI0034CF07F8
MINTRKSLATVAIALSAGLGFTACSNGGNNAGPESSQSQQAQQGLSDEAKGQVEGFLDGYYQHVSGFKAPEVPKDISDILNKVKEPGDSKDVNKLADAINSSLNDEDKKKVIDYLKQNDPTYNDFDREGLSDGQNIVLSVVNMGMGSSLAGAKQMGAGDAQLKADQSKLEFGDNTATLKKDALSLESKDGSSASAQPSDQASDKSGQPSGDEINKQIGDRLGEMLDGVQAKRVDDSWKIDGKQFLEHFNKMAASSSPSAK